MCRAKRQSIGRQRPTAAASQQLAMADCTGSQPKDDSIKAAHSGDGLEQAGAARSAGSAPADRRVGT
jgi:ribosomal protein S26